MPDTPRAPTDAPPPMRPRIARMFLITQLLRAGVITREQATIALREGGRNGSGLAKALLRRGWVSPQRMRHELAVLRQRMIELS